MADVAKPAPAESSTNEPEELPFWRHPQFWDLVRRAQSTGYAINGYNSDDERRAVDQCLPPIVRRIMATPQVPQHSALFDVMHGHDAMQEETYRHLARGPFVSSSMVADIRGEGFRGAATIRERLFIAAGLEKNSIDPKFAAHGHRYEPRAISLFAEKTGYCVANLGTIWLPSDGRLVDSGDFIGWRRKAGCENVPMHVAVTSDSYWDIVMGEAKVRSLARVRPCIVRVPLHAFLLLRLCDSVRALLSVRVDQLGRHQSTFFYSQQEQQEPVRPTAHPCRRAWPATMGGAHFFRCRSAMWRRTAYRGVMGTTAFRVLASA